MKRILISGATLTGKTMVAIGLAARLRDMGKSVAYFKPIGEKKYGDNGTPYDDDARLMRMLLKMDAKEPCICPILRTVTAFEELLRTGRDALLKKIHECYKTVIQDAEYVLIEASASPWDLLHIGLSGPQIARELGASVICLVNFQNTNAVDDVLLNRDFFRHYGIETIGVVLMMVPPMFKSVVRDVITPLLNEAGVRVCGVVYQNRELFSPTIRDILHALEGQMITGEDKLDLVIDRFMIGSMAPENALKWFREAHDKAVITSGDRADLCLAALETDTNLLILTGGMGPDIRTVARAKELGVPIMMTSKDTYTTGQTVDSLVGNVTPENIQKTELVERIVGAALDLEMIESLPPK